MKHAKNKVKKNKNPKLKAILSANSGFTLVELMVVVAIVGILSAIAIPNYQKYQAKARQSEAKIALAGIYTAESAFSADNGSFTQDISAAGYQPNGWAGTGGGAASATGSTPGTYYTEGFTTALVTTGCGPTGAVTCWASSYANGSPVTPNNASDAAGFTAALFSSPATAVPAVTSLPGTGTNISNAAFNAGALGYVSSSGTLDNWTMTNTNILTNTTSGI